MKSLYEQHRAAWDKLAANGTPHLAEAAKHFTRPGDMDQALGFVHAVHHWIAGRNPASKSSDMRAKAWLDARKKEPAPAPQSTGTLFLVACPPGTEDKARKLLAFIGCDVTEV